MSLFGNAFEWLSTSSSNSENQLWHKKDLTRPILDTVHGGYFQSELLHLRKGTITSGKYDFIWFLHDFILFSYDFLDRLIWFYIDFIWFYMLFHWFDMVFFMILYGFSYNSTLILIIIIFIIIIILEVWPKFSNDLFFWLLTLGLKFRLPPIFFQWPAFFDDW